MRKERITRTNIATHLLKYQLAIVDKKLADLLELDNWQFRWTITREQHEEFKQYSLFLIQKIFKINKNKAIETFEFFYKLFGLRIKN